MTVLIFFYSYFFFFPANSHINPKSPEAPDCEADTRWENEFQTAAGFPTAASSHRGFISARADGKSWGQQGSTKCKLRGFSILTAHKICHDHGVCLESAQWLAAAFGRGERSEQRMREHAGGLECIFTDPFAGGCLSDVTNCFIYS